MNETIGRARRGRDALAGQTEEGRLPGVRLWMVALGGLAATLVGNGIARFAYTPLIPALIAAGWFAPAEAVYLAAANLAGYLAGALGAQRLALRLGTVPALRMAMAATVVSLAACAFPWGVAWYLPWRFLAGVTGGVLMVLAAPAVLAWATPAQRGRVSGIVFTGVGVGIAASGTLVPLLAQQGLTLVWLMLAATAAVLTAYMWFALPQSAAVADAPRGRSARLPRSAVLLLVAYACDAAGFIPHTVFWVDFIARGLEQGLDVGGRYWIAFGMGAAVGPFLVGLLADRIGLGPSYILAMATKAAAVALPLAFTGAPALLASSLVVGALIAGTTSLCSAWTAEQVGPAQHRPVWGWMTSGFALAQAGSAWALSLLFAHTGSYALLFGIGAACLGAGTVAALFSARCQRA
jgi:predicted MFS family arabinose efflux permease